MNTIDQGVCETYQSLARVLCPFEKEESCLAQKCIAESIFWNTDNSPIAIHTASELLVLRDL